MKYENIKRSVMEDLYNYKIRMLEKPKLLKN